MAAAKPKNKGLGRGLDALFADQAPVYNPVKEEPASAPAPAADGNAVVYININDIQSHGRPSENRCPEVLHLGGRRR